jgi:hypothetical protein
VSRVPHRHAVVGVTALDLRRTPDHAAEMRSQLLLGETVRVLGVSREGRWWRVENHADGYRGWVRTWGLVGASEVRVRRWLARARFRISAPRAEVLARPGAGLSVSPLTWNARLIAGARRGGWRRVELPDGRRGWVSSRALRPLGAPGPGLMVRVESLLGIPYLWGGRTAAAFDCSGFVQQVLAESGVALPRDARQQFRATRALPRGGAPRPGDLAFFAPLGEPVAHVGLCLGGGWFAHARGCVRLGSMERSNPLYDNELSDQFVGYRRVPDPPRGRPRSPKST